MIYEIKNISEPIDKSKYGEKAYWLSWLYQHGFNVPYAIFLPAFKASFQIGDLTAHKNLLGKFLRPFINAGKYEVAVRSSATCEDLPQESFAGFFETIIGRMNFEEILHNVEKVIQSLHSPSVPPHCLMGVVIQKLVDAKFSGVAFSSDPLSGCIEKSVISMTSGMGKDLVAGLVKGEDILITSTETPPIIPRHKTPISNTQLLNIWRAAKDIESYLSQPINIEWCVEKGTDQLFIVQNRPVPSLLMKEVAPIPISLTNKDKIPYDLRSSGKVAMRIEAERHGIDVSSAYMIFVRRDKNSIQVSDLSSIQPSPLCTAYSVVLISPEKLSGKVIRSFAGKSMLKQAVEEVASVASRHHWSSVLIAQEIFDAEYTGIIRKIQDGFLIEVARGHFVPKGVVPTSIYLLNNEGIVKAIKQASQEFQFHLQEGNKIEVPVSVDDQTISIPEIEVQRIVDIFSPLFESGDVSVEFGSLKSLRNSQLNHYLIDIVREAEVEVINSEMIEEGIISKGIVSGILTEVVPEKDLNDLDVHFHDEVIREGKEEVARIFLCDTPNIALLKILAAYAPGKIGFIFKDASILCHLAIVLREKSIPAIQAENLEHIRPGQIVTVDTLSAGLSPSQRIIIHNKEGASLEQLHACGRFS